MSTDRPDFELTITEEKLLTIGENMEYATNQLSEAPNAEVVDNIGVRAQIAQAQALVIIGGEMIRLVNAVNGATMAMEKLGKATADPKLIEALTEIRKVISANG